MLMVSHSISSAAINFLFGLLMVNVFAVFGDKLNRLVLLFLHMQLSLNVQCDDELFNLESISQFERSLILKTAHITLNNFCSNAILSKIYFLLFAFLIVNNILLYADNYKGAFIILLCLNISMHYQAVVTHKQLKVKT